MEKRLQGVCPILPTAFHEDGSLDVASIRKEVDFLLRAGVDGIALFGNASEAFALTMAEREQIAAAVVEENAGRVPLVFGAGGTAVEPAIDSCLWAQAHGAQILMIMPPHMIKPDVPRIYDFYARIAEAVDLPIMIQDAPNACGVNIPLDTIVRLGKDFKNIQYVKAEAPPTFLKAEKIIRAAGESLTVFGGLNATFFYEELCVGVQGTMPAGEFPDVVVKIWQLFRQGKREEAREVFCRYLPFIRLGAIPGGMAMAVHKEVLARGGIFESNRVRAPFLQADEALIERVMDALADRPLLALSGFSNS